MIARISFLTTFILLSCLNPSRSWSQKTTVEDSELLIYFNQFNISLYELIQVSEKLQRPGKGNLAPGNEANITTPSYRLIDINCSLYEEIDPNIPYDIAGLHTDMAFQQIDEFHTYVRLQYQDILFWVHRSCVRQQLDQSEATTQPVDHTTDYRLVTFAQKIYEKHMSDYHSYIRYKKELSKGSDKTQFQKDFDKIEAKHYLIDQIYERLDLDKSITNNVAFKQKIKLNGRLLFGNSSFNTNYTNLTSGENSSGNVDVQLNAAYDLNPDSKVSFQLKNRKETLLTPYNNWNIGAGYDLKFGTNHRLLVSGNYETYKDAIFSINDYGKTSLNAQIQKTESSLFNYKLNYRFFDQVFDQIEQNSYSRHHVGFRSSINPSSDFSIQPGLIYNHGNSENTSFEYNFISPSLIFAFDRQQGSNQIKLSFERTDYSNLELRNNSRIQVEWMALKRYQNNSSKNNQTGLIYRKFSETEQSNYLDIYSKSIGRNNQKTNRFMVRYRHFPNIDKSDRLDIRSGMDQSGAFYLGYDVNLRLQYPTEEYFFSRLDGYMKLGAEKNGFRIGPFLRWHLAIDLKNTQLGVIDRDQNSYQYGVESSGYFKIAKRGRLRYRASYDLNTVFSRAIDPTDPTMALDAELRHPKNFQFDLDLGVKVIQHLELFAVANYFNHETDYEEDINSSFIMNNTGNRFKVGVRINYN